MTNAITINNQDLALRQYNGQMVITFKDIDLVHNRPQGTAGRNFRVNKKHFIEGEDYFKIQPDEIRRVGIKSPNGGIVVTESGYLMLVKSFTDDLSWEVQRQLVKTYFRYKEQFSEFKPKTDKPYEYFDKTYNGVPVLTTSDVEYLTGVNATTVVAHLRRKTKAGKDYYRLVGEELKSFKDENSKFKRINCLYVITREGFMKICRAYGIKIEEPKFFEMKAEKEKKYNPHKYVISLMGHIDRDTILINEYKNRLINSKTLREAEYNREMLLKAMCSLHGYELDTKSIILR